MMEALKEDLKVFEVTRSFSAPVEVVYRAFTEAEALGRWGVGKTYDNLAVDLDVRPGGVIHHRVRAKESGDEWTFFGVYEHVEPNKKLAYTFDWKSDWRESPTPSLVTLTFHDRGQTTELELVHSRLPEPAMSSTETHWAEFLDLLEELLVKKEIA
ncbi:MAG: SRPBCC domain-containing protein [Chloroflexi bacterium]|nr:SRPBCC domain-containing protein [Chloroflexota bacterium]